VSSFQDALTFELSANCPSDERIDRQVFALTQSLQSVYEI